VNQFWLKIKHGNTAKVAAAYAAVSWVLLQAQEAILPTIGAPVWVAQTILFLMLVGFPIACVIAWASDANSNIEFTSIQPESASPAAPTLAKGQGKKSLWLGLPVILLIALFAFYISPYVFDFEPRPQRNELAIAGSAAIGKAQSPRFELNIGDTGTSEWGLSTEISISPNGQYVAFTKNGNGAGEIFLRDLLRNGSIRKLADYRWATDVHGVLNFSENGEWITYFDSGILKRVRTAGGAPQNIMNTTLGRTSGYHVFNDSVIFTGVDDFLEQLNLKSGERSLVEGFDQLDTSLIYRWPQQLPDGKTIMVSATSASNSESVILLFDKKTFQVTELISNAVNARFVERTGHIVFVRDSALWAVPFDLDAQLVVGLETKLVDRLETNGILGSAAYAFSEQGRLVFLKGEDVSVASTKLRLDVLTREGEIVSTLDTQGRLGQLDLSPDGSNLSFTKYENAQSDIWVYNLDQSISGRRTFDGNSVRARWADSSTLFFSSFSEASGHNGIWTAAADGSSAPALFMENTGSFSRAPAMLMSVSMAAEKLFYYWGAMLGQGSHWSIGLSEAEEKTVAEVDVTPNVADIWWSRLQVSPNGRWVVYVSNESGSNQIYVRPYPEISGGKFQISALDAVSPIWSEDGKEIFFRSGNRFFSAKYEEIFTESRAFIDFEEPELLFEHKIVENHLTFPAYVYNASSETFIILSTGDAEDSVFQEDSYLGQTTLTVIENWFSELESLSPRVE
jgi:Tol biopolymer transport system component